LIEAFFWWVGEPNTDETISAWHPDDFASAKQERLRLEGVVTEADVQGGAATTAVANFAASPVAPKLREQRPPASPCRPQ
jgi:hypothetical protein